MKGRRFARSTQAQAPATDWQGLDRTIGQLPRSRRRRPTARRAFWSRSKVAGIGVTALVIVAVAYLAYLAGMSVLRSDLNRVNAELNQRVQAQSTELARLQAKSSDLEAKLGVATTDLGIVRSKLQLQRATLRAYQARVHLASGSQSEALKDLNEASLALDAAGAIASSDVKNQISGALQLVREADSVIRTEGSAVPTLERLSDQLTTLTAD